MFIQFRSCYCSSDFSVMWLQVEKGVYKSDFQERLVLQILKGDTSSRKINKKNEVNEAVCYYNLSK